MTAIMIAKEYNISNKDIVSAISEFNGVEHRLEYVDTVDGVRYYNDTEATNIRCSQIALSSFKCPIILFLGGLEREQKFEDLNDYMENVKAIIAIGECRERVRDYARSINKDVYVYEHLVDGFDKAVEISEPGDVVLLEKKLIVAAQVRKIRSMYIWDNKVCNEPEYELQVFTEGRLYDVLEKTIKENHQYDVPQIICLPMINTTNEWGKWLSDYVGG